MREVSVSYASGRMAKYHDGGLQLCRFPAFLEGRLPFRTSPIQIRPKANGPACRSLASEIRFPFLLTVVPRALQSSGPCGESRRRRHFASGDARGIDRRHAEQRFGPRQWNLDNCLFSIDTYRHLSKLLSDTVGCSLHFMDSLCLQNPNRKLSDRGVYRICLKPNWKFWRVCGTQGRSRRDRFVSS